MVVDKHSNRQYIGSTDLFKGSGYTDRVTLDCSFVYWLSGCWTPRRWCFVIRSRAFFIGVRVCRMLLNAG